MFLLFYNSSLKCVFFSADAVEVDASVEVAAIDDKLLLPKLYCTNLVKIQKGDYLQITTFLNSIDVVYRFSLFSYSKKTSTKS